MRPSGGWVSGYRSPLASSPFVRTGGKGTWSFREWEGTRPVPLQLSATLWLDSSSASSLWDATSGGAAVTSNGAVVRRWEDLSGSGNNVTGSSGPTLSTSGQNGLNTLAFSSQLLTSTAFKLTSSSAASLFAVMKFATSGNQIAAGFGTQSSYAGLTLEANVRTGGSHSAAFGSNLTSSENYAVGGAVTNTFRCYGAVYGSGVGTLYVSGASTGTVSRASALNGGTGFTVGGYFGLAGYYLAGNVCEIVYVPRALTATEISQLYNYLKNKWSVP